MEIYFRLSLENGKSPYLLLGNKVYFYVVRHNRVRLPNTHTIDEGLTFLAEVRRQFSYLFGEYQFKVSRAAGTSGEEFCEIILESNECEIEFYLSREVPEVSFARTSFDHHREWYSLHSLLPFFRQLSPEKWSNVPLEESSWTTERCLARYSAMLRPYISDIVNLMSANSEEELLAFLRFLQRPRS